MKHRALSIVLIVAFLFTCVIPSVAIADSYWILMDSPPPRLAFWGQNATYINVCDAIVDALNSAAEDSASQGNQPWSYAMVYTLIGATVLKQLAIDTTGCYVKYESYYAQIIGQPIQYLYQVTILDNNLNYLKGPYRYQPNPYINSVPGKEEDQ